ncbi:IS1 family transposase, partial [Xenorhabdus japonica]
MPLFAFKKRKPRCVTTLPLDNVNVQLICEVDEVWSFVGNKKCRRWLWSAWEPRLKRILAHTFGTRSKKTLKKLASFNIVFWCTDNFKAYNLLPKNQHLVGKTFTQRIERENLTLRNRLKRPNRKTLGYSKSPEIMGWTPHLSGISVPKWQCIQHSHLITGASTMKMTTVGIDLAKNVFQIHGVDVQGETVLKKQLS